MVERGWRPAARLMTIFTDIVCGQVRRRLTGGFSSVMATEARASDAAMVEGSGRPAAGLVAIFARVAGGQVRC